MKLEKGLLDELVVHPGAPAGLDGRSTECTTIGWLGSDERRYKKVAKEDLASFVDELSRAQRLLWASDTHALLVVLQAMDAAGKDGTIRHVMSGVNPQGCNVESFKQPSRQELGHDFLWRATSALPERGMIGIFNRSYYEEVLVDRVHPALLARGEAVPATPPAAQVWQDRFEDIRSFEHHLHRNGTRIVKLFLHVSKEEQKRRFLERLDDPDKKWKFSAADLAERQYWDAYLAAYEDALAATSTEWAPWYVVPADHKYALRALVGGIIVHAVDAMDLEVRAPNPSEQERLDRAREQLLSE